MSILMDGWAVAQVLEDSLKPRVHALKDAGHGSPTLATILVGSDPASATYVGRKGDACRRVGMQSVSITLPEATTTDELLRVIDDLNANPDVHGILLQHPVPHQINERQCFDRIALDKDVDGVTSQGFGLMAMGERAYGSATPAGIMRLLAHYDIPLAGREAVVVGRSPILGKPMAQMLLNANATVTVCHSQTGDLDKVIQRAGIVVGALGKPEFIKGAWIRDGAVVVDAGAHPNKVGDIELAAVANRSFAYTPVPGGVGPMTIATLIAQTVDAAERKSSRLYAR